MVDLSRNTDSTADDDRFTGRLHELQLHYLAWCLQRHRHRVEAEALRRFPRDSLDDPASRHRLPELCFTLRLPDGRAAVDAFVDGASGLSGEEAQALRRFQQVLPGMVYEVVYRRGPAIRVLDAQHNRYLTVRMPPGSVEEMPEDPIGPGALLMMKVVPLRDSYTYLCALHVVRAEDRKAVAQSLRQQLTEQLLRGEKHPTLRFTGIGGFRGPGRR